MTASTAKKRTITLTGRAPVTIREDRWPVVAKAHGDSYQGHDSACHDQASTRGELDEYHILVRQHSDGRAIVYGILTSAGPWTGTTANRRGGELLEPGDDLAAAIQRVGEDVGIPDGIVCECVADLPPEDLDTDLAS